MMLNLKDELKEMQEFEAFQQGIAQWKRANHSRMH
jgi:hypothetical protein